MGWFAAMRNIIATASLGLIAMNSPWSQTEKGRLAPDVIVLNAIVRTMDRNQPLAEALAVSGNRIAAVGKTSEIRPLADGKTRIIDAGGSLVLPGFNAAHVHFLNGGFELSGVDLRDTKSPREFADRLGEYAAKMPKERWIRGSLPGTVAARPTQDPHLRRFAVAGMGTHRPHRCPRRIRRRHAARRRLERIQRWQSGLEHGTVL